MNVLRKLYEEHFVRKEVEEASELCMKAYKYIHERNPKPDEIAAFTYACIILNNEDLLKEIISQKE